MLGVAAAARAGRSPSEDDAAGRAESVHPRARDLAARLRRRSRPGRATVTLEGEPHEVVGVMPAGFDFPG